MSYQENWPPGRHSPVSVAAEGRKRKTSVKVIGTDLRLRYANAVLRETYGPELIGQECFRAFHERERPCVACPALRCMESGAPTVETKLASRDEAFLSLSSHPLVRRGRIEGVINRARDVSEDVSLQQASESTQALTHTIIASLPDLLVRCNRQGCCIEVLTHDDEKLFLPREELPGRHLEDVLPLDAAEHIGRLIETVTKATGVAGIRILHANPAGPSGV